MILALIKKGATIMDAQLALQEQIEKLRNRCCDYCGQKHYEEGRKDCFACGAPLEGGG